MLLFTAPLYWSTNVYLKAENGRIVIDDFTEEYFSAFSTKYYEHGDRKLTLINMPPSFNSKKLIAPDVDALPYIESVTTVEGKATFTYRWP